MTEVTWNAELVARAQKMMLPDPLPAGESAVGLGDISEEALILGLQQVRPGIELALDGRAIVCVPRRAGRYIVKNSTLMGWKEGSDGRITRASFWTLMRGEERFYLLLWYQARCLLAKACGLCGGSKQVPALFAGGMKLCPKC